MGRLDLPATAALVVPVAAGAGYMAAAGAPPALPLTNLAALGLGAAFIALAPQVRRAAVLHGLTALLAALLFVPLVSGPRMEGVARWIPMGSVTLHAGMLALPPLAVLAARSPGLAAPILLAALLAAMLQPDAALAFGVTFAAVGLYHAGRDWTVALTAIAGFAAAIALAARPALPPQPFVERVIVEAAGWHWAAALLLVASMAASYLLVLYAAPLARQERFALAGSLFGFAVIALMNNYPSPLIGFGAAPILGYGLALSLRSRDRS